MIVLKGVMMMLNKDFYKELQTESNIIDEFNSLSLSGKEVIATLILDNLEKNGISAPVFVAQYVSNKKAAAKEDEVFINV